MDGTRVNGFTVGQDEVFFEPVRRRKLVYYVMLKATATAPRVLTPWTLKVFKSVYAF